MATERARLDGTMPALARARASGRARQVQARVSCRRSACRRTRRTSRRIVADAMDDAQIGLALIFFSRPSNASVARLRSCASSTITTPYLVSRGSSMSSRSNTPSCRTGSSSCRACTRSRTAPRTHILTGGAHLLGDARGDRLRGDPSRLSARNHAPAGAPARLRQVLRHLRGLAASRLAHEHRRRPGLHQEQDGVAAREDGQTRPLRGEREIFVAVVRHRRPPPRRGPPLGSEARPRGARLPERPAARPRGARASEHNRPEGTHGERFHVGVSRPRGRPESGRRASKSDGRRRKEYMY